MPATPLFPPPASDPAAGAAPHPAPLPAGDDAALLAQWLPLDRLRIVELGCGDARLLRALLAAHPSSEALACEVDAIQHARNLAAPQERLRFAAAPAQEIPAADASFELALMLRSLHHVPPEQMARALAEVARVLRPGGHLYVSEPVYAGALNELIRRFNDEREVRAAAQAALDAALAGGAWEAVAEHRFETPVHFADFGEFERRMMRPSFADHRIDAAKLAELRAAFEPLMGADGVHLGRPTHVRLLRRR